MTSNRFFEVELLENWKSGKDLSNQLSVTVYQHPDKEVEIEFHLCSELGADVYADGFTLENLRELREALTILIEEVEPLNPNG